MRKPLQCECFMPIVIIAILVTQRTFQFQTFWWPFCCLKSYLTFLVEIKSWQLKNANLEVNKNGLMITEYVVVYWNWWQGLVQLQRTGKRFFCLSRGILKELCTKHSSEIKQITNFQETINTIFHYICVSLWQWKHKKIIKRNE